MKPKLYRTIAGGILGTGILIMLMYPVAHLILGYPMDPALVLVAIAGLPPVIGVLGFILNGIVVFPLAYKVIVMRMFTGAPWLRGFKWGLLLWFAGELLLLSIPAGNTMYYHSQSLPVVAVSIIGHTLYGITLGAVAGNC